MYKPKLIRLVELDELKRLHASLNDWAENVGCENADVLAVVSFKIASLEDEIKSKGGRL